MMKNKICYILAFITLAFFAVIFIQGKAHIFKPKELNGVYYTPKAPEFTFESYCDGSMQKSIDDYLRYNFGFREVFIRFYNQYIWDFYKKALNKTIIVGKDNWLYGSNDVENYHESAMYNYTSDRNEMAKKLSLEASRMYKVQKILKEYGIFLFMTIEPGKSFVFPEFLPENDKYKRKPFHAIEFYRQAFDSLNVNYIDLNQWFINQKGKTKYPLFPKSGLHWSHVASVYAFDTIVKYIEHENDMNLNNYSVVGIHPCEPEKPDDDIEKLLNLMRPIKGNVYYKAETEFTEDSTVVTPKYLVVGDSYNWNILKSVPIGGIFEKSPYWYYNSSLFHHEKYKSLDEFDYLDEILRYKIINLAYSPAQLFVFSNGFLPKTLLFLCHDDEEIDSVANEIAKTIDNISDEEKLKNARKTLFSEPEKYFNDLSTNDIPVKRNKRIKAIMKKYYDIEID